MSKLKLTFEVYHTDTKEEPDMNWIITFNLKVYENTLFLKSSLYNFDIPYEQYLKYKNTKDCNIFTHTYFNLFYPEDGGFGNSNDVTYKCIKAELK